MPRALLKKISAYPLGLFIFCLLFYAVLSADRLSAEPQMPVEQGTSFGMQKSKLMQEDDIVN